MGAAIEPQADAGERRCQNCATPLQGAFCHACGQSAENPLRSVRHAIEDVFESFWHLDGRVFRTLRDLLVPGRVACNFLAGQRVRYVAPLRLMVVLSVLTFFVGHFAIRTGEGAVQIDTGERAGVPTQDIASATSVEEVVRRRDAALRTIDADRAELAARSPLAAQALDVARAQVVKAAEARIRALQGGTPATAPAAPAPPAAKAPAGEEDGWNPNREPVAIGFLPDAANAWLTTQVRRGVANAERARHEPQRIVDAWMKALPSALLVLVPVFALLLKLFYLLQRRLYLEHLTVALYSHVFLLLVLLAFFLASILDDALAAVPGAGVVLGLVRAALWLWTPIYLLLSQKRIYRQGWLLTVAKYLAIGTIYVLLLSFAILASLIVGLVRM